MNDLPDEIALIYAAAQTQQQQAQESLDRLQQHTQQLDALVRDTVRYAAVEALHAVHSEAERARVSLHEVHRAALPRVFWMTVGSAGAGLIATLILGACFVPSKEEIAQRQATLAALPGAFTLLAGGSLLVVVANVLFGINTHGRTLEELDAQAESQRTDAPAHHAAGGLR